MRKEIIPIPLNDCSILRVLFSLKRREKQSWFWLLFNGFGIRSAFTLIELMVVVVLVGIMAGFAIPSYNKAMESARVRRGRLYLTTIYSASEIYKAKNGQYPEMQCGNWSGNPDADANKACLQSINSTLGINIPWDPDVAFNYNYNSSSYPVTFRADVVRDNPCWVLRVTSAEPDPTWSGGYSWPS